MARDDFKNAILELATEHRDDIRKFLVNILMEVKHAPTRQELETAEMNRRNLEIINRGQATRAALEAQKDEDARRIAAVLDAFAAQLDGTGKFDPEMLPEGFLESLNPRDANQCAAYQGSTLANRINVGSLESFLSTCRGIMSAKAIARGMRQSAAAA